MVFGCVMLHLGRWQLAKRLPMLVTVSVLNHTLNLPFSYEKKKYTLNNCFFFLICYDEISVDFFYVSIFTSHFHSLIWFTQINDCRFLSKHEQLSIIDVSLMSKSKCQYMSERKTKSASINTESDVIVIGLVASTPFSLSIQLIEISVISTCVTLCLTIKPTVFD